MFQNTKKIDIPMSGKTDKASEMSKSLAVLVIGIRCYLAVLLRII